MIANGGKATEQVAEGGPVGAPSRRFCVAPMMDWTDRHDRFFLRLISWRALLYSEMITTGAVIHGDRARLLGFDTAEHPVALQLGGCDPEELAESARIAEGFGYDEVNLNCGCPSDRVQSGRFGACMMAEPEVVARGVEAMRAATRLPVTVKCRIGVDDCDGYEDLARFVRMVREGGCTTFVVHARKAWLHGLSPKENREIPPLRYADVYRLKAEHPDLEIVINGGIATLDAAAAHLTQVDGVMLGRAAYQDPYILAEVDRRFFADPHTAPSRHEVVEALIPYAERELARGARLGAIARHVLGLFQGQPGARAYRRHLAENAHRPGAGVEVIRAAAALVPIAGERRAA